MTVLKFKRKTLFSEWIRKFRLFLKQERKLADKYMEKVQNEKK